ncbi:MAG TPA: glycosyltransferase, partial [Patescibacteria group bacterium]|nr:glycosyltransferase [Patescibacteria group bacterium]
MKVIIAYASAGAGHSKAAEAVYNRFREKHPGVTAISIDILAQENCFFRYCYSHGYSFMVKYAPFLWQFGFWVCAWRPLRFLTRPIAKALNRLNTRNFAQFLIRESPDVIISTHFLTSEIAAALKKRNRINCRLITVITDFGVHPFWLSEGTDTYVAASEATRHVLLAEGIEDGRIRVLGIPVDEKFLSPGDAAALCRKFGIQENKFTVLVATGSFGIGPIARIVASLQDVQVLVVCAKNKKLYRSLQEAAYPQARVFGFVDNIQELMAVSDIIITKPGGLSTVESLSMGLFPIFIVPIPGQETENIRCLAEQGVGMYAKGI